MHPVNRGVAAPYRLAPLNLPLGLGCHYHTNRSAIRYLVQANDLATGQNLQCEF